MNKSDDVASRTRLFSHQASPENVTEQSHAPTKPEAELTRSLHPRRDLGSCIHAVTTLNRFPLGHGTSCPADSQRVPSPPANLAIPTTLVTWPASIQESRMMPPPPRITLHEHMRSNRWRRGNSRWLAGWSAAAPPAHLLAHLTSPRLRIFGRGPRTSGMYPRG